MANTLTIDQMAVVLNDIVQQATGRKSIAPVNTNEFMAVANTALLTGYDTLLKSVSQVLSRTIFSVRPYYAKFRGLKRDSIQWGNHVRKLQALDSDWESDERFEFANGDTVDMYKIKKPDVLQTNFYGQQVYKRHLTIFKDQLDVAFRSPDEFGRFLTMIMTNISDLIEQATDMTARMTVNNLIGGTYLGNTDSVVHCLSEYNTLTGLALTPTTVYQPENFTSFIKWLYSIIATISDSLTDRTVLHHVNITGKTLSRHTPYARQQMYLYSPLLNSISTSVLSDVYHNQLLKLGDYEKVNYWQQPEDADTINVAPNYMGADGSVVTGEATEIGNVIGVLMDDEAAGITTVNQWSATTPFNADGGYSNTFWHFTHRTWNDFTENVVVFLLD